MITKLIGDLGPWNWWILALILMGIEIIAPGSFFLWFGIAAFIVGSISLAVGPETTFWVWQTQVVGFVVLALVSALVGRRYFSQSAQNSENPTLNERAVQMVGRSGVISEPITGGMGRARIGETTWRVSGPDLPVGTPVQVVREEAGVLVVHAETRHAG